MIYTKILCITGLVFLLVSTGSVFAVEPTTFPGPKNTIAPDKRMKKAGVPGVAKATAKKSLKVKETPGKQKVETDVTADPTGKPQKAPGAKKK